ncbi:ATP-binding cassette domain-containing protein [Mycoplasma procyoni]|uniref:ATP-binding cassette domain-containing protein n=1 Tax=Mycoplasma procyoni TaxID=568784 RepID=UPI00197C2190|nr:ABC transporter ATP-binding protein [Mycoplasma procyoni]MBN3534814.1 ABC transporter ATP-binding protein [Mycoplasma procyoni]
MFKYLKREKNLTFITIFLEIIVALELVFAVYIPSIINQYIQENKEKEFYIWISIQGAVILVSILSMIARMVLKNGKLLSRLRFHMREDILKSTVNETTLNFDKVAKGKFISQIKDQVPMIIDRVYLPFFALFGYATSIIASLVLALILSLNLALIILLFSIITTFIPLALAPFVNKNFRRIFDTYEKGTVELNSFLGTYKMFYFLNTRDIFVHRLEDINYKVRTKLARKFMLIFSMEVGSWLIITITDMMLVGVTGWFVLFKGEPLATITAIPMLSFKISLSARMSMWFFVNYKSLKDKINQFQQLPEYTEKNVFENQDVEFEYLEIKDLNYKYNDKNIVFQNFNFKFEKGKKYLIKGRSGSGKSTLINLITKQLKGYEGEILYNNYNIKNISNKDVNSLFTFLDSKEFVFFDSVYNNVTLWEQHKEQQVVDALEKVNLAHIDPNYNLDINNSLSTGQKQRINIARHFINNKKLLILDEALANIDQENITKIEKLLFENKELTILNISHHATNYSDYNVVIDMEEMRNEISIQDF